MRYHLLPKKYVTVLDQAEDIIHTMQVAYEAGDLVAESPIPLLFHKTHIHFTGIPTPRKLQELCQDPFLNRDLMALHREALDATVSIHIVLQTSLPQDPYRYAPPIFDWVARQLGSVGPLIPTLLLANQEGEEEQSCLSIIAWASF
jgi:hypothetical protein